MKASEVLKIVSELIKENGDQEVMFQDPNANGGPFSVGKISMRKSAGEFPKDWCMPKGFKYFLMQNY